MKKSRKSQTPTKKPATQSAVIKQLTMIGAPSVRQRIKSATHFVVLVQSSLPKHEAEEGAISCHLDNTVVEAMHSSLNAVIDGLYWLSILDAKILDTLAPTDDQRAAAEESTLVR